MITRIGASIFFCICAVGALIVASPENSLHIAREWESGAAMYQYAAAAIFTLVYAIAFGFTIPITTVLLLLVGFFYGFFVGVVLAISATVLGAVSVFLFARHYPTRLCKTLLGSRYESIITEAKKYPISYLLSTRLMPLVPFPFVHIIPAEAGIRVQDFLWTTLLGTVPATLLFVALGSESRMLAAGESINLLPTVIGLASLSFAIFLPLIFRRQLKKTSTFQKDM